MPCYTVLTFWRLFTNCQIFFLSIVAIPSIKSVCSSCTSQWLFYSVRWKDWFSCIWLLIILNSIIPFTTTFCLINYLCMYFSHCTTDFFFYCFVTSDGKKRSMRCDVDKVKGVLFIFFFFGQFLVVNDMFNLKSKILYLCYFLVVIHRSYISAYNY